MLLLDTYGLHWAEKVLVVKNKWSSLSSVHYSILQRLHIINILVQQLLSHFTFDCISRQCFVFIKTIVIYIVFLLLYIHVLVQKAISGNSFKYSANLVLL